MIEAQFLPHNGKNTQHTLCPAHLHVREPGKVVPSLAKALSAPEGFVTLGIESEARAQAYGTEARRERDGASRWDIGATY